MVDKHFSFQGEWQETSSKKKKKQPTSTKSDNIIEIKPEKREKSKEREFNDRPERDRENHPRNDRRNRQPPRLARKRAVSSLDRDTRFTSQ